MFTTNYNKYIPLIFSLFIFILFNNLIGLIPYSFTAPSHIIFTFSFSLSIIIGVTIIGFQIHKLSFFKLFVPHGLNQGFIKFLIPLIFSIEIISYLMRILSLSVRLTANLLSGHTLLKILSTFSFQFIVLFPYLFFLPLILIFAVYLLEIGVAFIQAYVFSLLTATYIKDIYSSH